MPGIIPVHQISFSGSFLINGSISFSVIRTLSFMRRSCSLSFVPATTVPVSGVGLLRARVTFGRSFLLNLKSFFYKDEAFYIILRYLDGKMQKYKIVPQNGCDGIWINPHFETLGKVDQVQQVMFDCTRPGIMLPYLQVDWEATDFIGDPGCLFSCFNYLATKADSCATIPSR